MKAILILTAVLAIATLNVAAQSSNPGMKELREKVISWDKIMPPKGNAIGSSRTIQGHTYTPYQLGLIDTFITWIKGSYIPIGGLPQAERLALPDRIDHPPYLPLGTGVAMWMWDPCYDATGKKIIKAQPASASIISILTNHIPGMDEASWYNTPTQFYFTMYYDRKGKLVNEEDEQLQIPVVNELKSKVGDYLIYFTGNLIQVILIPGNELPIVQITKDEVLNKGEEAVKRAFAAKSISQNILDDVLANIVELREKYKNNLPEPAFINKSQLGIYAFSQGMDIFKKGNSHRYMFPVYKIDSALYAQSKKDMPGFVTISWPLATEKSSTADWEIYKAMTKNFNFDYVYNYFFNPDKVKDIKYQPLNPVSQQAAIERVEKKQSSSSQTKILPAGVHFMEDFSTTADRTMPAGWTSSQSNRGFNIVALKDEQGKWLELDRLADLIPSSLKFPLPENFSLEYDVATSDFSGRTGGAIDFHLADKKNGTSITFNLTPGDAQAFSSYASTAQLEFQLPREIKYYANYASITFNDFSNQNRKAHITIKKTGRKFLIFINDQQMPFVDKYKNDNSKEYLLPEGTVFNSIFWKDKSQDADVKSYISNIKITKE